ncbi:hypothetical protein BG005_002773 [Podila minutissima]|nr:hypothetical protein BG005_002773 [Podila minutissima]
MDFETKDEDKHITIRFPQTDELDFAITKRDLLRRNVEVIKEIGSEDQKENWKSWQGEFERTSPQNSVLHVKLYTAKANRYQAEIVQRREERMRLLSELQVTVQHRNQHASQNGANMAKIKRIVKNHSEGIQILGFVANEYLTPEIFQALMIAEAYMGDTAQCAKKVQAVYMSLAMSLPKPQSLPKQIQSAQVADATEVSQDPPATKYSILCLGESQSGKSTLIEHLKNYADPGYAIDQTRLGDGIFSKTKRTSAIVVKSNLPSYEVYSKQSGDIIDLDSTSKGANAEDIEDLLLSREKDVGLRLVPNDPNRPEPDDVEFEIIDTPGVCNHKGQDRDNALSIIDGMISAQPLKLILIVVNIHDPLGADLLLTFQYYSKVLYGLHSNIAFLFTHADVGSLVDPGMRNALDHKTLFLSRIFRTPESGKAIPYPSFTIDLTQRRLPILQFMIRSTLRNILQLAASNSPVFMDKRRSNIEMIRHIDHPSEFDDLQRNMALEGIYGEPRLQTKHGGSPPSLPSSVLLQSINILLIGDAQSGKSSLIESMKLYADPLSVSNMELFVKGEKGATDEIIRGCTFVTDLHTMEIVKAEKTGNHRIIDIEREAQLRPYTAFEELLFADQPNVSTHAVHPSVLRKYQFSIFEVPGWQEDVVPPQDKAAAIHRAISESNTEIHQVLVTLGPDAITNATETVIGELVKMTPNASPLLAFVHTKINYRNLHVDNITFHDDVKVKEEKLQGLLIRSNPPIFAIDNDFNTNVPVQHAITLNTIHEILLAAIKSKPKYSVLVLGKTQSGKSSLVQHIKRYADPAYLIDNSLIGNGNTSKTGSTGQFFIHSDLPAYKVLELATGTIVDVQNLHAMIENEDDYLDILHGREAKYGLKMVPQEPHRSPPQLVEFRFLDTPGINDTNHMDDIFAVDIISEVIATGSFNLILIVVSAKNPLSKEYGFALEYYAKVLQGLHTNIAFLYTHVDYAHCHHTNTTHHLSMLKRHNSFSRIFRDLRYLPIENLHGGADTEETRDYRHFKIDLHSTKRPVVQCLIQNTLRDILQLAVKSLPVDLDTSKSNKERIWALVHPDKSNLEHRRRLQADMRPDEPPATQSKGKEVCRSSEHGAVEGTAAPAAITTQTPSDHDGDDYFPKTEKEPETDDKRDSSSDVPEARADDGVKEE